MTLRDLQAVIFKMELTISFWGFFIVGLILPIVGYPKIGYNCRLIAVALLIVNLIWHLKSWWIAMLTLLTFTCC